MYSQHSQQSNKQYAQAGQSGNSSGFSQQQYYQGLPQGAHPSVQIDLFRK